MPGGHDGPAQWDLTAFRTAGIVAVLDHPSVRWDLAAVGAAGIVAALDGIRGFGLGRARALVAARPGLGRRIPTRPSAIAAHGITGTAPGAAIVSTTVVSTNVAAASIIGGAGRSQTSAPVTRVAASTPLFSLIGSTLG